MMRVFTRAPDGTAAQLHVATEAGTDGLRALVQARHGIPAGMQRLVYGGRRILGGASLASYGLEDGATVEICLELLGGGASWPPETLNFRHVTRCHVPLDTDTYLRASALRMPHCHLLGLASPFSHRCRPQSRIGKKESRANTRLWTQRPTPGARCATCV